MRSRLSIIIPSRHQPQQLGFLTRAITSIRAQTIAQTLDVEILIAIDHDTVPPSLTDTNGVQFIEAPLRGQAVAMNAGAAAATGDYLAFLEDDDRWHPARLQLALPLLARMDFTSSNQQEVDTHDAFVRINDFPTPSGWLMRHSTWSTVGPFNIDFRWHLDHEWLGRLSRSNLTRAHLVDSTAPKDLQSLKTKRPWLHNCLLYGGPNLSLSFHNSATPIVTRMVHSNSGMAQINSHPEAKATSSLEYQRLVRQFGYLPW